MLKDIEIPKVEGVAIDVIKDENSESDWTVYLINTRNERLEGVLISSRGYGEIEGIKKKTTTFRHFLDVLDPLSFQNDRTNKSGGFWTQQ